MYNVDVLLPTRDASWMFEEAITSILTQQGVRLRVIVVDDSREPETQKRLREYCARFPQVLLVTNEGEGIVDALNSGLAHVTAEFCARMDADDYSLPERLRIQAEWLTRHPQHVLIGGLVRYFDESGNLLDPIDWQGLGSPITPTEIVTRLRDHNCIFHPAVMFRSESVRRAGGYRADYPHIEDYDLWVRLENLGLMENLPYPVLLYRLHSGQVSSKFADQQSSSLQELVRSLEPAPFAGSPTVSRPFETFWPSTNFNCILQLHDIYALDAVLKDLEAQEDAVLNTLFIMHSLPSRQATRLQRWLDESQGGGPRLLLAPAERADAALTEWLRELDPFSPIIFLDSRDQCAPDRVHRQALAISERAGTWSLGQASCDGIPRSSIYPTDYLFRQPEGIASRADEYFRSNVCLHASTLLGLLARVNLVSGGSMAASIAHTADPADLVELPCQISEIRSDYLPLNARTSRLFHGICLRVRNFAAAVRRRWRRA